MLLLTAILSTILSIHSRLTALLEYIDLLYLSDSRKQMFGFLPINYYSKILKFILNRAISYSYFARICSYYASILICLLPLCTYYANNFPGKIDASLLTGYKAIQYSDFSIMEIAHMQKVVSHGCTSGSAKVMNAWNSTCRPSYRAQ